MPTSVTTVYDFDSPSLHVHGHARPPQPRASSGLLARKKQRPSVAVEAKKDLKAKRAALLEQKPAEMTLPAMSSRRVGGVGDGDLKEQLAQAVFSFSDTPAERPMHGDTPSSYADSATPIPVATTFFGPRTAQQPPARGGAARIAATPEPLMLPPPPQPSPVVQQQLRHQPMRPPAAAKPAADTPSAAQLLNKRQAAAAAAPAPASAAGTCTPLLSAAGAAAGVAAGAVTFAATDTPAAATDTPATATPASTAPAAASAVAAAPDAAEDIGLMWEEMADDSDDEGETPAHRPMRVPTKVEGEFTSNPYRNLISREPSERLRTRMNTGLADERKYDISSMLDEDDDPFGW